MENPLGGVEGSDKIGKGLMAGSKEICRDCIAAPSTVSAHC
jgi:hypothetical protein